MHRAILNTAASIYSVFLFGLNCAQAQSKGNDGMLLHQGILNPETRFQLYKRAWDDLEAAARAYYDLSPVHEVNFLQILAAI
eukprot:scaffold478201_cov38-Prasinocladus_malaysianus.AAC.1